MVFSFRQPVSPNISIHNQYIPMKKHGNHVDFQEIISRSPMGNLQKSQRPGPWSQCHLQQGGERIQDHIGAHRKFGKSESKWLWINTCTYHFLVGWTSIYQLFWGSLGTRVLTHPQIWKSAWWLSKSENLREIWLEPIFSCSPAGMMKKSDEVHHFSKGLIQSESSLESRFVCWFEHIQFSFVSVAKMVTYLQIRLITWFVRVDMFDLRWWIMSSFTNL